MPNSSVSNQSALLVFHGSHDPQYQMAVQQFLAELQQDGRSGSLPDLSIQAGFLDCVPEPLHQQIIQMVAGRGSRSMLIMPLFLSPGVHVMEDIPAEVAIAQAKLPQVRLQVLPYLGSLPALTTALGQTFGQMFNQTVSQTHATGRIVIAHGSRRSGGNQPIEALADALDAIPAFWSVSPSLETQVQGLYDRGVRLIEVLPYLLFEGSLTAGMRDRIKAMLQTWPDLEIKLLPTLSQQSSLIELVIKSFLS